MIKACIFDLDGTLLYTLDSMARPGNQALNALGLPSLPVENYRLYCGEGAHTLVERLLRAAGDTQASLIDKAYPLYMEIFSQDPLYKVEPFPGIPELLKALREKGILLGVCSNKPHQATVEVISTLFPGLFPVIIGQRDQVRRKPFPDMPLMVSKLLGVSPQECLYLGDSGTDMKTGNAARMHTVGVLWGYRSREELLTNGAHALAERPADIQLLAEKKDWVLPSQP